jgi:hypothetical protein
MLEYRAFMVGVDGHILRAIELVCPNDESAKEYARQLVDGCDVELWQGERQIQTFSTGNVR